MDNESRSKGRETFLTIFLVVVFGGACAYFLDLISMGIFSFVLKIIIGLTILGSIHYLVWGHWLSRDVAGEREELELQERMQRDHDVSDERF